MTDPTHFGARLRQWRQARELTQSDVARRIGKSRGWLAGVEAGEIPPPDAATCAALADAIHVDREEVWRTAAPVRLEKLDPDVAAFFRRQLDTTQPAPSPAEWRLLQAVRALDERAPGLQEHLTHFCEVLLLDEVEVTLGVRSMAPHGLEVFLRRLRYADAETVHRLIPVLAGLAAGADHLSLRTVAELVQRFTDVQEAYMRAPRQPWADPRVEAYRRPDDQAAEE